MSQLTMEQLFEEAEANGKWFFSPYQGLWFSPSELRAARSEGKFKWGVENWQLRNPQEALELRKREAEEAQREYERFKARLEATEVKADA